MHAFREDLVSHHMSAPVNVIADTERLSRVEEELVRRGVSALAVVDRTGSLCGVISRTDLLRAGRLRIVKNGHRRQVLSLPDASVREFMSPIVEVLAPDATLGAAARRMATQHLHRLFISSERRPIGVVSTTDLMRAVASARVITPVIELMHSSIVSVNASDPLSLAVERLALAHHGGIVVLDEAWPVGMFTQEDALAARSAPPDDRVDDWMDARVIMLPVRMPLFRAAEQLVATRARRLVAVDAASPRGIVTGSDFARLVADQRS